MKNIEIFDNFVPKFYQNSLYEMATHPALPWFFSKNTSGSQNNSITINGEKNKIAKNQTGFSHLAYISDTGENSIFYQRIIPLIFAIQENIGYEINNVFRVRLGLTLNQKDNCGIILPHVDYDIPHKTLLYYVNDSDGDTIFYKERFDSFEKNINNFHIDRINSPKMGSAVIFDGDIYHSSTLPKNNDFRITININFN